MGIATVLSVSRIATNFVASMGLVLFLQTTLLTQRPDLKDADGRVRDAPSFALHDEYDFVVIGGGSAGAVVASRLSEVEEWRVLLLEAGGDEPLMADIPLLFPLQQLSETDWQLRTQPSSEFCLAMRDSRCNWPRGKVLGGCSVLNAMLYVRGNRKDYDSWAQMGNEGWAYEDILPYFKKSEGIRIDALINDTFHGDDGPLTVEYFKYATPMVDWFLEAGNQLGYPTRDLNGEEQSGFMRSQGTIRDGLRCSTAKAFLRPTRARRNLHISMHSRAQRIIVEEGSARSVHFTKNGESKKVRARTEIILSAGAVHSPQLLMLSGIGPGDELRKHNIEVKVDAPGVGSNLQDHIAMGGNAFLYTPPKECAARDEGCGFIVTKTMTARTVERFIQQRDGPLYGLPECEAMAFVATPLGERSWPDVQLFLGSYADSTDGGLMGKRVFGLTDDFYAHVFEPIVYHDAFSVTPLLMRPASTGRITLASANPSDAPLIFPNYYSDPKDMKVMVRLLYCFQFICFDAIFY